MEGAWVGGFGGKKGGGYFTHSSSFLFFSVMDIAHTKDHTYTEHCGDLVQILGGF